MLHLLRHHNITATGFLLLSQQILLFYQIPISTSLIHTQTLNKLCNPTMSTGLDFGIPSTFYYSTP